MCNLYSVTTNIQAIRDLVKGFRVNEAASGNFPPQTAIFPDYLAPSFATSRESAS